MTRYALIPNARADAIRPYLPRNYAAANLGAFDNRVIVTGVDEAGWTLDGYVLPRLASGLHFGREIDPDTFDALIDDAEAGDRIETRNLRGITAPDF